jgi:hypothetical protein
MTNTEQLRGSILECYRSIQKFEFLHTRRGVGRAQHKIRDLQDRDWDCCEKGAMRGKKRKLARFSLIHSQSSFEI